MQTRVIIRTPEPGPSIALDDRIFLGEGLFETIRVEKARPCFAFLHWQRLFDSAQKLGIPFDLSFDDWSSCLVDEIKRDNLYHGGIKAILSGGSAPRGLAQRGQISHLMLQTFSTSPQSMPLHLVSSSWLRDAKNPIYQVKSINYLEAILARREALSEQADDTLFFNTQGHVTETTCANVFLISKNELITPPLTDGVLPGVTRGRILSLCDQLKIGYKERSVTSGMMERADAVFVTNSLQGIRGVCRLDQMSLKSEHDLLEQLALLIFQE